MLSPLVFLTFLASVLLCWLYRQLALRWHIFDVPNERSAHQRPTPRGGGVGLFLALVAGVILAAATLDTWPPPYGVLLLTGGLLVLIGLFDDIYGLPARWRMLGYAVLCTAVVVWLWWPAPPLLLGLASFYLLWLLNLYNFMDGIDGLAALEALFVCLAAAALGSSIGIPQWQILFCLLLAAVCAGFLVWNLPTASLFMGDAGSITLGFLLGLLSLLGETQAGLPLLSWLILLAVFVSDATVTLLRRILTRQAFSEAHSQHLYQRLARYWGQPGWVLWAVLAVNVLWLLPLAAVAALWPEWSWGALVAAYVPLLAGVANSDILP
ncbi:MAG: glycosyl transferase [Gammaproteobacteria bacterium]|nr:glycosyl transferase [Gammaproteobacteria bacterium]